jgi:hypothetical protein
MWRSENKEALLFVNKKKQKNFVEEARGAVTVWGTTNKSFWRWVGLNFRVRPKSGVDRSSA